MIQLDALVTRFDAPSVRAIVLFGSFACGDPDAFSDVDLACLLAADAPELPGEGTHLVDGRLVVVSSVRPAEVEAAFTRPEIAVDTIAGLRAGKALLDRDDTFARIQARARDFVWDEAMQTRANAWASRQMVYWIEEVHKGLGGLREGQHDVGRLLNARFGLSWGLSRVVQVHQGVLISGDNAFYEEMAEALGRDSEWVRLRQIAFGIAGDGGAPPSLRAQVTAGLRLYAVTSDLMRNALQPRDASLVEATAALIRMIV